MADTRNDIRVLYAGRINTRKPWSMPRHQHRTFHEMLIVAGGQMEVRSGDVSYVAGAGQALFYRRRWPHAEQMVGRGGLDMLFVAWEGPDPSTDWPVLTADRRGRILVLLRWILELFPNRSPSDMHTMNGLMQNALHEFASLHDQPGEDALDRAERHIRAHLTEPLQLEDLAEVACMSRFHFARQFESRFGQPPMRYLRSLRVESATRLLAGSDLPLRAIAPLVGLGNEYNLSRVFKRVTGRSPGKAR